VLLGKKPKTPSALSDVKAIQLKAGSYSGTLQGSAEKAAVQIKLAFQSG